MKRQMSLPPEFQEIEGLINYVTRVGSNEFSSSCPECHGESHIDGSWPDRFRLFVSSRATGGPLGWCRSCGYTWVPGKGKGGWKPDPETQARWQEERRQAEERRLSEVEKALDILNHEKSWQLYHDALTQEARAIYRSRGITDDYWLGYWELGYCQSFTVNYKEGEDWLSYESDSLTIPIFQENSGNVISLRHRLLHPQRVQDRYRPALKGLPAAPFICDRDRELSGPLLLVEGEFKAMASYLCLDDCNLHVAGLPGKSPDLDILAKFANCDPVYLLLDPDAYILSKQEVKQKVCQTAAQRLTQAIGPGRVRWIRLPDKVDDMITGGIIKKAQLRSFLRGARRAW